MTKITEEELNKIGLTSTRSDFRTFRETNKIGSHFFIGNDVPLESMEDFKKYLLILDYKIPAND